MPKTMIVGQARPTNTHSRLLLLLLLQFIVSAGVRPAKNTDKKIRILKLEFKASEELKAALH